MKLETVLDALVEAGGRPYVVGGAVRDYFLGQPGHDIDVEVFNLPDQNLLDVLEHFGKVRFFGRQFGIYQIAGLEQVDFALPRRETKTGSGHRGFAIQSDPYLELKKAASRRDFTINALYYDWERKCLEDPYEGLDDLSRGILRVVDFDHFSEDPLRVLRMARFLARLNFQPDPASKALCEKMVASHELDTLSPERVSDELEKLCLSPYPAAGIRFLKSISYLDVAEEALAKLTNMPALADPLPYILYCLKSGGYMVPLVKKAPWQKEQALEKDLKELMNLLGQPYDETEFKLFLARAKSERGALFALVPEGTWLEEVKDIEVPSPLVRGRDLLDLGFKPGRKLGKLLKQAYIMQLSGRDKETILSELRGNDHGSGEPGGQRREGQ